MYSVLVLHSSQSHSTFSFLSEAAVTCFLMLCNGCFPFCLSSHYAFYSFYALVHPEDQHHSPLLKLSNSKLKTISCPFNISTYTFHTCSAFSILQIWRQQGLENRHVTVSSWPSFSPQGKSRSSRFLSSCPPWGGRRREAAVDDEDTANVSAKWAVLSTIHYFYIRNRRKQGHDCTQNWWHVTSRDFSHSPHTLLNFLTPILFPFTLLLKPFEAGNST